MDKYKNKYRIPSARLEGYDYGNAGMYFVTICTANRAHFFGEIALLLSMPRTASIRARGYCDLYSLDKETFERILGRYPSFAETIRELAEIRREEINSAKIKKESIDRN